MGKKTLKDWSAEDKPREKMLLKGVQTLSDAELIAILIGSGNKDMTAVDLAREILIDNKSNLNSLAKLSINELMTYKGIGEAKAITIVAALELGKRRNSSELMSNPLITSPKDIFDYMYPILGDLNHEEFWVIFLNQANKIIGRKKIGQGGINKTTVDIRLIMKQAIENLTISIILCHNHPSGNLNASDADILITQKINEAAKTLDIKLLDHLIISYNKYLSFSDENLI